MHLNLSQNTDEKNWSLWYVENSNNKQSYQNSLKKALRWVNKKNSKNAFKLFKKKISINFTYFKKAFTFVRSLFNVRVVDVLLCEKL